MRRNTRKIPLAVGALDNCAVINVRFLETVAPTPKMGDHCFVVRKLRVSVERFLCNLSIPMEALSQLIEEITVGVGHSSEHENHGLNPFDLGIVENHL